MLRTAALTVVALAPLLASPAPSIPNVELVAPTARTGVLLLAHGGSPDWDANVRDIAAGVNLSRPTEVALGMATRANIQAAVDRLEARGVASIVAVPLFVSSHSSVIDATEYLLGLRPDMPEALRVFATMTHGSHPAAHAGHETSAEDGTRPIRSHVPVRMTAALDAHPLLASIVMARALDMSASAASEAVILVAHGPSTTGDNERWLANLRIVADQIRVQVPFARIDAITVRDDAAEAIREAATLELRALVEQRRAEGLRVLIVPVLLSYGGIEAGIRLRLEGLDYTMARQALAPDPRLIEWVRTMATDRPPQ